MSATYIPPSGAADLAAHIAATAAYVHEQAVPAATWTVVHARGAFPLQVAVIDSAGTVVLGEIVHDTINQLRLLFAVPFAGKARVSL